MGKQIHITHVAERFSSHTQMRSRPCRGRASGDIEALRERLIEATVEVLAEGSVLRLDKLRARA